MPDTHFRDTGEDPSDYDHEPAPRAMPATEQMVSLQFRSRGVRGPVTQAGNRGRVIMSGEVPIDLVPYLQRLRVGSEAGLCEPFSIWMDQGPPDSWSMITTTHLKPDERKDQVDRAQAEHDAQMHALQMQLKSTQSEASNAQLQLDFVQRRIALEQATLECVRAEIIQTREQLAADRQQAAGEREEMRMERTQRTNERAVWAAQDASERSTREQQATQSFAAIQSLLNASADQFKQTLESNRDTIAAIKEGINIEVQATKALIASEQSVQQLVQTAKLNAVTNATELKDQMNAVPAPSATPAQPFPYEAIMDRAFAALGVTLSMITGRPLPTLPG